jgi:hypothetical protein
VIPGDFRDAMAHRWPIRVRNGESEDIPPFACMRITGCEEVDGQPVYTVGKPNSDFKRLYLVNGPFVIGTGSEDEGRASYLTNGGRVLYESGTPALGESWGPASGQWGLSKWRYGFTIIGDDTTQAGNSSIVAQQFAVNSVLCKADEDIASGGSSGTVSVYDGNQADTGSNLAVTNRTGVDFDSGKWGHAMWLGGTWYVEAWECPA